MEHETTQPRSDFDYPAMFRKAVDELINQSGAFTFSCTARELVGAAVRSDMLEKVALGDLPGIDDDEIERQTEHAYRAIGDELRPLLKSGFAGNTIKRHMYKKHSRLVKVGFKYSRREEMVIITVSNAEDQEHARKVITQASRTKAGRNEKELAQFIKRIDAFQPNLSRLPADITVGTIAELVMQLKKYALEDISL